MITDKERLWLRRIQAKLDGKWSCPGGRVLRTRRLWKKQLKYMLRYERAFMDGVDEVFDRHTAGHSPGEDGDQ